MKIRKHSIDDALIIHKELGCNPEMLHYTGWNPYSTLESTKDFISNAINSESNYSWVIEEDNQVVGTIGAYDYNPLDESIEIGYSIFQSFWGKGYASQAVALVCDFLSSNTSIRCIKAWSADENIASQKVLERNGFMKKEIKESAINVNGESYNQVFFEKFIDR